MEPILDETNASQTPAGGRVAPPLHCRLGWRAPLILTLLGVGIIGASCGGSGGGGVDAGTGGASTCKAGETNCDGTCADLSTDALNCGRCGMACASVKVGSTCQSGVCLCPSGQHPCGHQGACIADTDANCGSSCIACTGGTKCKNGSCLWPVLTLEPTKPTYAAGEQIVIKVTYTNPTPDDTPPCMMINSTMGVLTIASMTLDGKPVLPTTNHIHFDGGMTNSLVNNLVSVSPKDWVSVWWKSHVSPVATFNRYTLEAISLGDRDVGDVVQWPVKSPGKYELNVNYATPLAPGMPANMCRFTDTASVGFIITP